MGGKVRVQTRVWLTPSLCVCVCVCVFPTPQPCPLCSETWWERVVGKQSGCGHYTDIKRPLGTALKNTSHAFTICIDFKYPLEAPESQLLPLF